jgi:hypothetical protein
MPELLAGAVVVWVLCGVVGAIIGSRRNAEGLGFFLGVLFGPLGAIAAFALDNRPPCPECHNKIDKGVRVCSACRVQLVWQGQKVLPAWLAENLEAERQQRQEELLAEEHVRKKNHDEQIALRVAKARARNVAILRWVSTILRRASVAICRPFVEANDFFYAIAEGSQAIYRFLQIGCFVLIPLTVIVGIAVAVSLAPPSRGRADERASQQPAAKEVEPGP